MMAMFCFILALITSTVGALCGIGGGVVLKPVLDLTLDMGVSAISFLSGCTVLAMSAVSVGRKVAAHESGIEYGRITWLALGASAGGLIGKYLFDLTGRLAGNTDVTGMIQSLLLATLTIGTFIYTLKKSHLKTWNIHQPVICIIVGLGLGILSSFLGIGGGPFNLMFLSLFFSMNTVTAAANSLYIILFSQATSLIFTIATNQVPSFDILYLVLMAAGGIGGAMAGRWFNKRLSEHAIEVLYLIMMVIIICICLVNAWRFMQVI